MRTYLGERTQGVVAGKYLRQDRQGPIQLDTGGMLSILKLCVSSEPSCSHYSNSIHRIANGHIPLFYNRCDSIVDPVAFYLKRYLDTLLMPDHSC